MKALNLFRTITLSSSLALLSPALTAAETAPLLERDKWEFGDRTAWGWSGEGGGTVLRLEKPSDYKPKVRSPFNLAWFTGGSWGSFTLTAEVRLDKFDKGNNDVCIAFGKEGETKFYYAHLGEKADAVHLQLHLVNDADRKAITGKGAETLPWMPETWHKVKVNRDLESGKIIVWFDGEQVLEAVDKTLARGMIGLGSFDDLGSFRNVTVTEKE